MSKPPTKGQDPAAAVLEAAPPADIEAERGVLGAALNDRKALADALGMLRPFDFSVPEHGRLFRAITEAAESLEPEEHIDLPMMVRTLRTAGILEDLGGSLFLETLSNECVAPAMVRFHALAIQKVAARRDARDVGLALARQVSRPDADPAKIITEHQGRLAGILTRVNADGESIIGHGTAAISILADIEAERLTWLWQGRIPGGKVTLLAGDPGRGKTLLSLDIAGRVSRGMPWPDLPGERQPPGGVVLLSAEDDAADTIRPPASDKASTLSIWSSSAGK